MTDSPANSLADDIYERIKESIFDFLLVPGERFSENQIAARMGVSRTPVREALFRLRREGYIKVVPRSGWIIEPLDFQHFDELYDVRVTLELAAVDTLIGQRQEEPFKRLCSTWLVSEEDRERNWRLAAQLDEEFHCGLLEAAGNRVMADMHQGVMERIRIVRRIDFIQDHRIDIAYDEHAAIIYAILAGDGSEARHLLGEHVISSRNQARRVTLHMLNVARERLASEQRGNESWG